MSADVPPLLAGTGQEAGRSLQTGRGRLAQGDQTGAGAGGGRGGGAVVGSLRDAEGDWACLKGTELVCLKEACLKDSLMLSWWWMSLRKIGTNAVTFMSFEYAEQAV